jgi:hypothetical protein
MFCCRRKHQHKSITPESTNQNKCAVALVLSYNIPCLLLEKLLAGLPSLV